MSPPVQTLSVAAVLGLEDRLERAWPALETLRIPGFVLRFAAGYGRRANCARGDRISGAFDRRDVRAVELAFEARGLRPTFKVVTGGPRAHVLDELLSHRGYERSEAFSTWTSAALSPASAPAAAPELATIVAADPGEVAAAIGRVTGAPEEHLAALKKIAATTSAFRLLGTVGPASDPAACAIAVVDGTFCSLQHLATKPAQRRRGYARQVIGGLLQRAAWIGATSALVQIADDNLASVQLFRELGFRRLYGYHYRVREPGAG